MIRFCKTKKVKSPVRGTKESAGFDFFIPDEADFFTINPGYSTLIPSGIKVIIPSGYVGIFFNKSGIGSKGIVVGAQVIDSDYRGEVHLNVHNISLDPQVFHPGQKLVQMIILPLAWADFSELSIERYNELSSTERGAGGFGSTGA